MAGVFINHASIGAQPANFAESRHVYCELQNQEWVMPELFMNRRESNTSRGHALTDADEGGNLSLRLSAANCRHLD
jgi:hypothetical protein